MASQPNRLPPGARPKTTQRNPPPRQEKKPRTQTSNEPRITNGSSKKENKRRVDNTLATGSDKIGDTTRGDATPRKFLATENGRREEKYGRNRTREKPMHRSTNRNRSRSVKGGRTRTLDEYILRQYLQKEPTEIIMDLATEKSGWKEFLDQRELSSAITVLILEILEKACVCTSSPGNLNNFLAVVWQSKFLTTHLTLYASSLSTAGGTEEDLHNIHNLLTLLRTLLQCFQSSSSEVGVIVKLLEEVFKDNDTIPNEIKEQVAGLKEIFEQLENDRSKSQNRAMARMHYQTPPDDFRSIQIVPHIHELGKTRRPFLRHNKKEGEYQNVDHYLDVQFRLLREDFVAPLREGVAEYIDNQGAGKPQRRLQDVRLYFGVRIIRPILTRDGPGHLLEFDTTPFQKVRWESSKRLINGSLLCLTDDNFKSVIFATVEGRDVWQLEKGRIEVKFINLADIIGKPVDATFLMAETSAYYESYRHVLQGLQEYNKDNLPMTAYVVDASSHSKPPTYVEENDACYDLRVIGLQKESSTEDGGDECVLNPEHVKRVEARIRSVRLMQPITWPQAEHLHFDESQMEAFMAALTNEFVLIQGPPGTGKTYVGLKIVKTLLYNCHAWCRKEAAEDDWDFRPILVVCYTNHALDQFLEGIFEYESNIVRVGGRCKSEKLERCNIFNVRKKMRDLREVPDHIRRRRADLDRFYEVRDILTAAHERIALAQTGVLSARTLYEKKIITLSQYRSLLSRNQHTHDPMYLWLGLDGKGLPKEPPTGKHRKNTGQNNTAEDNEDEDEESDDDFIQIMEEAELLAEQRQLEDDPTFMKHREESLVKLVSEFIFVPGRTNKNESKAAKYDRRKYERNVEYSVNRRDMMTQEEAKTVVDLWHLSYAQRWQLYRLWLDEYIAIQEQVMLRYQNAYETLSRQRKELNQEEDYFILKKACVIGLTTTGAAKHRHLLQRIRPRIIVVEEAAEVLEAHIITTLSKDCEHLILIGDHQQLRPNPTVYRLAKQFNLDVSLFERMINNGLPCHRLGLQHRMRPEISILMKEHFYDGLDDHQSVMNYESVMGVKTNMFFLEHNHKELKNDDNRSKSNMHEAKFLVALCRYFLQQGYDPPRITVLTTYTGQLFNFKKLMKRDEFEGVRVSVVDNYQGEENDIVLLSLVRSNEKGSIGFLKVSNRVCVALSRAKVGLFCIGNVKLLAEQSDLWKKIVNTTVSAGQVGPQLSLVCQNHPETVTEVSTAEDFSKVPDGGCSIECEFRLECGHACRSYCHPKDPFHEEYQCMKDCKTKCPRKHKCTLKCYEECNCQFLLTKLFAACQHSYKVKCHEIETAVCQRPCQKKLQRCKHPCPSVCGEMCPEECMNRCPKKISCGHSCPRLCGKPCLSRAECKLPIEIQLPKCGHTCIVPCCDDPKLKTLKLYPKCDQMCTKSLKCGHTCQRLCKERCETKCEIVVKKTWDSCNHSAKMKCHISVNATCRSNCSRELLCGHACTKKCKEPCVTECQKVVAHTCSKCLRTSRIPCFKAKTLVCKLPCRKMLSCGHRCTKTCNDPCDATECSLPCRRKLVLCGHPCNMKCKEICDVTMCRAMCKEKLQCGHQCQKKCNEACETTCQQQTLKKLDCGHMVTVPCSEDVKGVSCFRNCNKKLPCGHSCKKICGMTCTEICLEDTEKIIAECGHKIIAACSDTPEPWMCKEQCENKLECGHSCPRECGRLCVKTCSKMVNKQLPDCKHTYKTLCTTDPKTLTCNSSCETTLECGHKCAAKCREPCSQKCEKVVTKVDPFCGHKLQLLCHESVALKTCRKPCKTKLPCGHNCPKMCFEPCKIVVEDASENKRATHQENSLTSKLVSFFQFDTKETSSRVIAKLPVCMAKVRKPGACGHQVEVLCYEDPNAKKCRSPCKKLLPCDHACSLLCSDKCETAECKVNVWKSLPMCNHQMKMPCSQDPKNAVCQKPCIKKLPCGHQCPKLCSESCQKTDDYCHIVVNKRRPGCNHTVELQCWEDPANVSCLKPCKKELDCGHKCPNACWQPCESVQKCTVKVPKTIRKCGHVAKLPCHLNPDSGNFCSKKCSKEFKCGHKCQEKCGKPCTTLCKEVVPVKILPCKHLARNTPCHVEPGKVECRERCSSILECGHDCKNACNECSHNLNGKGKASVCQDVCNKPLKCGHKCTRSKCKDCFGGRIHQHCRVIVNTMLVCGCKVREQCCKLLDAGHFSFSGHRGHGDARGRTGYCLLAERFSFNEEEHLEDDDNICKHKSTRGLCREPCEKILKCGHQCIGVCGEICLKLCRFCNRREVLKIFPEFSATSDPTYIQLKHCDHIFEMTDLERKLSIAPRTSNCEPILPIICPKCGTPIAEKRFNRYSATVKRDIQSINDILRRQSSSELRVAQQYLSKSKYKVTTNKSARNDKQRPRKSTSVVPRRPRKDMAWKLQILVSLQELCERTSVNLGRQSSRLGVFITMKETSSKKTRICLEEMLDDQTPLTEQLADDLCCEMDRICWCYGLATMLSAVYNYPLAKREMINEAFEMATSSHRFTVQRQKEINGILDSALSQHLGLSILRVQKQSTGQLPRELIMNMLREQVGFSAGDWYKCPLGHIFHSRNRPSESGNKEIQQPICCICYDESHHVIASRLVFGCMF